MADEEARAAYFALLRAREELDAVRRYGEFVAEEVRRIRRFLREWEAAETTVPPAMRRTLRHSDATVRDALRDRVGLLEDERHDLPGREQAAEQFVAECERAHAELSRRR